MRLRNFTNVLIIIVFGIAGCQPDGEVDPWWVFAPHSSQMIPTRALSNQLLPIAVETEGDIREQSIYQFSISSSPPSLQPADVIVKRGRGAALVSITGSGETVVSGECGNTVVGFCSLIHILENPLVRELAGDLTGNNLIWDSTSVICITSNIRVPAGNTLLIQPGTIVTLAAQAEIIVEGSIDCDGEGSPVQFLPAVPGIPWGQIDHRPGANAAYASVFFVGGGGNPSRAFGHSASQAVLGGEQCSVIADNIVIMDCPGKACGFLQSNITVSNSLITRCDTGGEFAESLVQVSYSHILDIPDGDGAIDDDDNDGIYLFAPWNEGSNPSIIKHCVFMTCEDDAIDHNGANVLISDCVIDGMYHEGLAASNANSATITNTLVINCEQGIEAGYGNPAIVVNHCTLLNNRIGLRFGDSYDWGCTGRINMTNSIIHDSDSLNVWNYDLTIEAPREGTIGITYSIVNQAEYDSCTGCLTGTPSFNRDYQLLSGSIGNKAASDNLNMGILPFE